MHSRRIRRRRKGEVKSPKRVRRKLSARKERGRGMFICIEVNSSVCVYSMAIGTKEGRNSNEIVKERVIRKNVARHRSVKARKV